MSSPLHSDLEELKKQLLQLGSMVEVAVNNSIHALAYRDIDLAEQVIAKENEIEACRAITRAL